MDGILKKGKKLLRYASVWKVRYSAVPETEVK